MIIVSTDIATLWLPL